MKQLINEKILKSFEDKDFLKIENIKIFRFYASK